MICYRPPPRWNSIGKGISGKPEIPFFFVQNKRKER